MLKLEDSGKVLETEELLRDLRDDDLQVSKEAANVLVRSGDERFLSHLLYYLADKSHLNRGGVAYGLRRFDPDLVLEPLLCVLSDDSEDWGTRDGAFWAFVGMKEVRAIPSMIVLLKTLASGEEEINILGEKDNYSTYSFIRGIGDMCKKVGNAALFQEAIEPLRHFLSDPREKARLAAARSLSDLGEPV